MLTIKSFEFSPIQENTYILYNEFNECAIIDPGCYFDDEKEMLSQFINEKNLRPVLLLNTHCHLDHVFGNKYVSELYDLELHIHEGEMPVLQFATTSGLMYDLPFENYQGHFKFLKEGDLINIGGDKMEVLFTPGHSPASVCFYCKEQNFVIGGDVLFRQSIGRTDLPGGNFETLIASIKNKLLVLPDETKIYSGHGPETTIGIEKVTNPFIS